MENSKKLLMYALDSLKEAGIPDNGWHIGGGTVLSSIYNHRLSKDIDVFLEDIQSLSYLSPKIIEPDNLYAYLEDGNYTTLTFKEGKVDFIFGPHLTAFPDKKIIFLGKETQVEDPIEIVTKKLFYRGYDTHARDIFDLAIVYDGDRKYDLINTLIEYPDKFDSFKNAFQIRILDNKIVPYSVTDKEMLLSNGIKIAGKEIDICKDFIQSVDKLQRIMSYRPDNNRDSAQDNFYKVGQDVLKKQGNKLTSKFNTEMIKKLLDKYSNRMVVKLMKDAPVQENFSKMISSISREGFTR